MKCTNCGLPLSPTNTNSYCPRCHAPTVSSPKPAVAPPSQRQYSNQGWGNRGEQRGGVGVSGIQGNPWEQAQAQPLSPTPSSPLWTAGPQQNQASFPPIAQTPFPQPGQMWQPPKTPTPAPGPTSSPVPLVVPTRGFSSPQYAIPAPVEQPGMGIRNGMDGGYASPATVVHTRQSRSANLSNNLGFIIAGLCVLTGGLLLVAVYFMASGLPSANTTSVYSITPAATQHNTPSPTKVVAVTPTVAVSPTAGTTYPGQLYINNPQMAGSVNTNTAQPLQTTTTFKVNQKIYVTFSIHPNGKNGAVCLYWYLNNRSVTQFPFAVTANAGAGYSFAVYGSTGSGYVAIYWASSIACSDKLLALHVPFTVTN
jgi:hypothetical protein